MLLPPGPCSLSSGADPLAGSARFGADHDCSAPREDKGPPCSVDAVNCALLPPQLTLPRPLLLGPGLASPRGTATSSRGAPRDPAPEPGRPIPAMRRFHRKSPPALFHGDDAQRPRVPRALTVQDPHSKGLIWGAVPVPCTPVMNKGSSKWAHTPSSSLFPEDTVCPYLPRTNAGKMKMSIKWLLWQPAVLFAATFSVL